MTTNTILRDALTEAESTIDYLRERMRSIRGLDRFPDVVNYTTRAIEQTDEASDKIAAALAAVDADQVPDEVDAHAYRSMKGMARSLGYGGVHAALSALKYFIDRESAARPAPFDETKLLQLCADWECYANTDKAQAAWRELVAFARPAPVGAVQAPADPYYWQKHAVFPVNILGGPMREYAPGNWESAVWPSAAAPAAPIVAEPIKRYTFPDHISRDGTPSYRVQDAKRAAEHAKPEPGEFEFGGIKFVRDEAVPPGEIKIVQPVIDSEAAFKSSAESVNRIWNAAFKADQQAGAVDGDAVCLRPHAAPMRFREPCCAKYRGSWKVR